MTDAFAIGLGLVATLAYSLGQPPTNWATLSASAMLAAASLAAGGFLGLLFGVPRTLGSAPGAGGDSPAVSIIGANTNLEQISDWLTKIIVGVSLTQLGAIKDGAIQLFNAIGPTLGGGAGVAGFAATVVIYFTVVGFLAGWLFARLRLGARMSLADQYLDLSQRAIRVGDTQTANAAKNRAKEITQAEGLKSSTTTTSNPSTTTPSSPEAEGSTKQSEH